MRLIAALLLISLPVQAETVTAVGKSLFAISHPADAQWEVRDRICARPTKGPEVCGTVIKVNEKAAFVKPDKAPTGLAKGNVARSLAAVPEDAVEAFMKGVNGPRLTTFNLGAGTVIGSNFVLPLFDFEYAPYDDGRLSLGLSPGFAMASSSSLISVSLIGGYGTLSYYFSELYSGFFARVGLGGFILGATDSVTNTTESAMLISGLGAIGYRIRLSRHFNITLLAEGQYFSEPNITLASILFTGFKPAGGIFLGYRF